MKQLFKPQLKMEQFIFKLEGASPEQARGPRAAAAAPSSTAILARISFRGKNGETEAEGEQKNAPSSRPRAAAPGGRLLPFFLRGRGLSFAVLLRFVVWRSLKIFKSGSVPFYKTLEEKTVARSSSLLILCDFPSVWIFC